MTENNSTKTIRIESAECVKCMAIKGRCVQASNKIFCYVKMSLGAFNEKLDGYCINSTRATINPEITTTTTFNESSFGANTTVVAHDLYGSGEQVVSMFIGCIIMMCLYTSFRTAQNPLFKHGLRVLCKIMRENCHQTCQFTITIIRYIIGKISGGGDGTTTPTFASPEPPLDNNFNYWTENGTGAALESTDTTGVAANAPQEEEKESVGGIFSNEEEEESDEMTNVAAWLAA